MGLHRIIELGTGDTGDIAHLILLGLSPSGTPGTDFAYIYIDNEAAIWPSAVSEAAAFASMSSETLASPLMASEAHVVPSVSAEALASPSMTGEAFHVSI